MRAYYFDNLPTDQRLPHSYDPPQLVSEEALKAAGVLYWQIPIDGQDQWVEEINAVARNRGYKNRDTIDVSRAGLGEVAST